MPWGDDSTWWKRRIRDEIDQHGPTPMEDLPNQAGLPEGLIEAVSELEAEDEVRVENEDGKRIIHPAGTEE